MALSKEEQAIVDQQTNIREKLNRFLTDSIPPGTNGNEALNWVGALLSAATEITISTQAAFEGCAPDYINGVRCIREMSGVLSRYYPVIPDMIVTEVGRN